LLDRWNRFQGGLKLEPIMKDGKHLRAKAGSLSQAVSIDNARRRQLFCWS